MTPELIRGAVLIVVMNRDDRRVLFGTLDAHEFDAIYTAKDFVEAHALLAQEPRIDLVVLEFQDDPREALQLCAAIEALPRARRAPVIGIASSDAMLRRIGQGPVHPLIVDWMRSPVMSPEALQRIQAALAPQHKRGITSETAAPPVAVPPAPAARPPAAVPRPSAPAARPPAAATRPPAATTAPVPAPKPAPAPSPAPAPAPAPAATPAAARPPPPTSGVSDARFAFDGHPDELLLSDFATGRILDANPAFEQRSGIARSQIVGTTLDELDLTHGAAERETLHQRLKRDGRVLYRCLRARADGTRYWAEASARVVMRGRDVLCLTSFREAGDTQGLEDAIRAAAAIGCATGTDLAQVVGDRLMAWLRPDYLWILGRRPEQDDIPHVRHHLPRPVSGTGPALDWIDLFQRLATGDPLIVTEHAARVLAGDRSVAALGLKALAAVPLTDERKDVVGALVLAASRPWSGQAGIREVLEVAAARLAQDLELERAREQGRAKGLQDSLTGLPNRLLFNDRLETTLKEAHRTGEMFAVLFVDLDRFKTINDSLGHGVGDEVLVAASKRLRASVRASDSVARYAGDEFTLILRHIVQREDVLRIAEKICRVLEAPLPLADGRELHITSSIGISFYPDDAATSDKLLQHADVAMYSAKGMGRNTFQTYVAVPEESHQQRLALEAKLRQAERNNELRVYYQPQVAATSEDIVGMEALIRWEHPELGMISPGFFIPLAEETGLIVPIGEWVLRQAVHDARRWQQRFGLMFRISVNLSALQLRQPNLRDVVARALADSGLEARYLELEVTESMSVKSIPGLLETLQALREMGCQIAIDDFGTGQSSLDYIRRFPADRIKIDQVFVRNIGVDPDDEAIVRATIHMAHNLNRSVVAEGVEYEEHFLFLREHGCEELQGYLFCRPLPPASIENLLTERERILAPDAA